MLAAFLKPRREHMPVWDMSFYTVEASHGETPSNNLIFRRIILSTNLINHSNEIFKQQWIPESTPSLQFPFSISVYFILNFIPEMAKLNFQHHYASLQCNMIFINHSNILICCSRNIFVITLKQFCCLMFLWRLWIGLKRTAFGKKTFVNVFVTFGHLLYTVLYTVKIVLSISVQVLSLKKTHTNC